MSLVYHVFFFTCLRAEGSFSPCQHLYACPSFTETPNENGFGTNENPPDKHDHMVTTAYKQNFTVSASSAEGTGSPRPFSLKVK